VPWRSTGRGANSPVGIYDRAYYREGRSGAGFNFSGSVVTKIIVVNVAVWIADFLTPQTLGGRWLSDHLAVHVGTLTQPWLWWQYLTAGFAHSPDQFQHILFNMLALFFLGRDVEEAYGAKEFLRVYLAMVVFASVVWSVVTKLSGAPDWVGAYGASGAIAGVVVLYAFNFPRRTLLLFFVIPIPAWLFGVLIVVMDMMGATGQAGAAKVAYSMHLAGAAFAFVYYQRRWNLTRLTEGRFHWPSFRPKPKLRIHQPEEPEPSDDLSAEVDRILEKIYREGEASLTAKERKTLEAASREYQQRVRTGGRKGRGE
jgi:membrane associated rhomboid family serine protease